MVKDQKETLETLDTAVQDTRLLWRSRYNDFIENRLDKAAYLEVTELLGDVRGNLQNFVRQAYLPDDLYHSPEEFNTPENEMAWQEDLRDTKYNKNLRPFFGKDRIPTSMEMSHLGTAFLAESNLLNFTNIPVELPEEYTCVSDPVKAAHRIIEEATNWPAGKAWASRIKPHIQYASEDTLRANPAFGVFIAAVSVFLDSQIKGDTEAKK